MVWLGVIIGFQDFRISRLWLNSNPVVHCSAESLFAAKIFYMYCSTYDVCAVGRYVELLL